MIFNIITIFPKIFDSYINESLFKRAIANGILKINLVNLRDYSNDKHKRVDDSPFGGGPGMVLKAEPIIRAVARIKNNELRIKSKKIRTILFSTRGKVFNQSVAKRLSKYDELIFICGRYEGVDERIADYVADEEISLGGYVLSGGELPAIVVIEATSRYIKGFLGKFESLEDIKGAYPTYTRPAEIVIMKGKKKKLIKVPSVLLTGNHKEINNWRAKR